MIVNGSAAALLATSSSPIVFAIGVTLYWTAQMAAYACLLGTATAQVETGCLVTFGSGAERLSYSLGTLVGGLVVAAFSYHVVGVFALDTSIVAATLVLLGDRSLA